MSKTFKRNKNPRPNWLEEVCEENNQHVHIGSETYFIAANGLLMPTRKDQPPPSLKYFNRAEK